MKNHSSNNQLTDAFGALLQAMEEMGHDISGDPNFVGTADRAAAAFSEMFLAPADVNRQLGEIFCDGFPLDPKGEWDCMAQDTGKAPGKGETRCRTESASRESEQEIPGMVMCVDTVGYGLCPHHLLPVIYRISTGYIPGQRIVGVSKLARAARLLASQPMLQETMTNRLATTLMEQLGARGAAASVRGFHLCMAARGAKCHESAIFTSCYKGLFAEDFSLKNEFLSHIHSAIQMGTPSPI